ncbi:MAG TPA: thioredoxin domain-containing protein, partial [Sphingomonas sp.]
MRILFVFSALLALTAAAPARDWSTVAAKTATGAYVIGNPQARVKLIEYASYTCSHCAEFSVQSDKEL